MLTDLMHLNVFNFGKSSNRINQSSGMNLNIQSGHLSAHVADEQETLEAIKLRGRIFDREYKGKIFSFKSDIDQYDQFAHHLIIKDNKTGKIVAGYRVIEANDDRKFYSGSEFDIKKIVELPGRKLELSKAVVHPAYRDGRTIQLIWKAILAYAEKKKAEYLFGIPSIPTTCAKEAESLYKWFQEQNLISEEIATPHDHYKIGGKHKLNFSSPEEAVPGLMRIYFKAGSRIVSPPAIDPVYKSTDFVILLKLSELSEKYKTRMDRIGNG
jgi:putative hemolysin